MPRITIGLRKPLNDAESSKIRTGLDAPTQWGGKSDGKKNELPRSGNLHFHIRNGHTGNTSSH
jgi:hypothetical protein